MHFGPSRGVMSARLCLLVTCRASFTVADPAAGCRGGLET